MEKNRNKPKINIRGEIEKITINQVIKSVNKLTLGSFVSIIGFIIAIFSLGIFITKFYYVYESNSQKELIDSLKNHIHTNNSKLKPQVVYWAPDFGKKPGIIIFPGNKYIPWEKLKIEIEEQIIRATDSVPKFYSVRYAPDKINKSDMLVQILDTLGNDIGHIWFGKDPLNDFKWDGLIRIGTPKEPRRVWATFQNISDSMIVNMKEFVSFKNIIY